MSIKSILGALAALMFLVLAPQARAQDVTNGEILACVTEWRAAYAAAHNMTRTDVLRMERAISTNPPTTLVIAGSPFTFNEQTLGQTVWSVCGERLAKRTAPVVQTTGVRPESVTRDGEASPARKDSVDALLSDASESPYQLEAQKRRNMAIMILGIVGIAGVVWYIWHSSKRQQKRRNPKRTLGERHQNLPQMSPYKDSPSRASRPPPDP